MENNEKFYDGQNRCRRCDRPLKDPNDLYGWRCAQIVGLGNEQVTENELDGSLPELYNAYVKKFLNIERKQRNDNFTIEGRNYKNTFVKEESKKLGEIKYRIITDITTLGEIFQVEYTIKNGALRFAFEDNDNYWSILWRGGGKTLAKAIYDAGKELSPDNFSGRTVDGINVELQLHWAAYKAGIREENAKAANIGGMKQDTEDYDKDAWLFESIQLAEDIIDPTASGVIELVKKVWGYLKK